MELNPEFPSQLEELHTSKRYIVRLISVDHKEQKTFCTSPTLAETVKKANQFGCEGNRLLLAEDGCEICDDDAYHFYIVKGARFMLATCPTQWRPAEKDSRHHLLHNYSQDSCELLYNDSTMLSKKPSDVHMPIQQLHASSEVMDHAECEQRGVDLCAVNSVLVEEKFRNVEVPWNQIPLEIREALARGEPLERKVHALTKHIVHELRAISTNIPIRVLRMIAHRLVSRYPKSFHRPGQSTDLLPTVLNLALAMRHHNNFLNRTDKCALQCCDPEANWQDYADEHAS